MKKLLATGLLAALANLALAQTPTQTYKITWSLLNFSAGGTIFTTLELDISETGRYLAAHGGILTETRQLSPATGTCSRVTNGGYFCNLQIDRSSYFLNLDGQLKGKITGRDALGNLLPEAALTLLRKE